MGDVSAVAAPAAASRPERLWEIDALRGVAVVLMVFFHFMWDLFHFGLSDVNVFSAEWQAFARSIGSTFTLLLGLSLAIRAEREAGAETWGATLRRAGWIFLWALVVSGATYAVVGDELVVFGILHMQALATLLARLFLRRSPWLTLAVALAMAIAGSQLQRMGAPYPWLIWLGLTQYGRNMVDYYPMLPWSAAALVGVAAGRLLYPGGRRAFALPPLGGLLPVRALRWLGSRSLTIYLVHQPVLLGALIALGRGHL